MTAPASVGFIGLGDQGAPLARAIADHGWTLHAWARRPDSLTALDGVDHVRCGSVAELAEASELVCLCVRDDTDVHALLCEGGLLLHLPADGVVANLGTGSPERAVAFEALARRAGIGFVDAPVSGGRPRAERRALTTIVGADDDLVARCRPVFDCFSAAVVHVGRVGDAQLVKLLNQLLFAANLARAGEAVTVARSIGFALDDLVPLLSVSSGASYALEALATEVTPGFVDHVRSLLTKDLAHLATTARGRGVDLGALERTALRGLRDLAAVSELLHPRSPDPT